LEWQKRTEKEDEEGKRKKATVPVYIPGLGETNNPNIYLEQ
jgi:hypothetical protein